MATLLSLPDELLVMLVSGLTGADVARVSQTCSHLRDVARVEEVWQRRCETGGISQGFIPVRFLVDLSFVLILPRSSLVTRPTVRVKSNPI